MKKRTYHLVQAVIKNVENKAFGFLESQNNIYWRKPQKFRPRPFPGARIAPKSDHITSWPCLLKVWVPPTVEIKEPF